MDYMPSTLKLNQMKARRESRLGWMITIAFVLGVCIIAVWLVEANQILAAHGY